MEKKLITVEVFRKQSNAPILFKDITIKLEPDDVINASYDEGFYSENNSWDPHYYLTVDRKRLETDEEFNKRIKKEKSSLEYLKERRYKSYLKLKKEFEEGIEDKDEDEPIKFPEFCRFCSKKIGDCNCE